MLFVRFPFQPRVYSNEMTLETFRMGSGHQKPGNFSPSCPPNLPSTYRELVGGGGGVLEIESITDGQ